MTYEPKIIAYLCTWCSYTGADTAGIARMKSPANLRAVRVPCSGRVSPELIMRTFDQGADGVLVLACHIGECHYDTGNHRTAKRLPIVRALMDFAGLEPERLRLDYVSASEGERFSRISTEFVETVKALGPVRWRVIGEQQLSDNRWVQDVTPPDRAHKADHQLSLSDQIRSKARELLSSGAVSCVIGYEVGPKGRTRPAFIYNPEDAQRLVWNAECTHNLTTYLREKVGVNRKRHPGEAPPRPVAIVAKPCDSRAINVLLAENQFERQMVHVIGVACEGINDANGILQEKCLECDERLPVVYDTLIGEPPRSLVHQTSRISQNLTTLEGLQPTERLEFWLSQFDRCIRCYACRQACPMCSCPVCLYERDDSLWVGPATGSLGVGLNEKRTFHLGRAYHLAGRCVGCNECERVCPMNIPISLLNRKLAEEIQTAFGHTAGLEPIPSPIVTMLSGEYKES